MPDVLAMTKDKNGQPIPVLSFRRGAGAHKIAITATSARNTEAIASPIVSIYSTVNCYIEIGDASVTSTITRHFIPLGVYLDIDMTDGNNQGTHIAVVRDTADGVLYVSERL